MTLSTCGENLVPLGYKWQEKRASGFLHIYTSTTSTVHVPGLLPTVVLLLWYRTVGTYRYLLACCLYFSTNSCAISYHPSPITHPPLHYKRKRKRASTRYTAHFIRSLTQRNNILHQNTNHYFWKNTLIIWNYGIPLPTIKLLHETYRICIHDWRDFFSFWCC